MVKIRRDLAKRKGVRFLGFDDLGPAKEFILRQNIQNLVEFGCGISLGCPLPRGYVDLLPPQEIRAAWTSYNFLHRHVDHWLDMISVKMGAIIEEFKYKPLSAPTDELYRYV